jgi:hypothetical protein
VAFIRTRLIRSDFQATSLESLKLLLLEKVLVVFLGKALHLLWIESLVNLLRRILHKVDVVVLSRSLAVV